MSEIDPATRLYRKIKHWEAMEARDNDPSVVKGRLTALSAKGHISDADEEAPVITYRVLSQDGQGRIDYRNLDGCDGVRSSKPRPPTEASLTF